MAKKRVSKSRKKSYLKRNSRRTIRRKDRRKDKKGKNKKTRKKKQRGGAHLPKGKGRVEILDEEDSIETYLKRCDSDGDGFLTVEEIHDCKLGNISGGSKKKRKRKSKRRPKSKKAGILSKQIRKIRRKRKIVSRRR